MSFEWVRDKQLKALYDYVTQESNYREDRLSGRFEQVVTVSEVKLNEFATLIFFGEYLGLEVFFNVTVLIPDYLYESNPELFFERGSDITRILRTNRFVGP